MKLKLTLSAEKEIDLSSSDQTDLVQQILDKYNEDMEDESDHTTDIADLGAGDIRDCIEKLIEDDVGSWIDDMDLDETHFQLEVK